MVNQKITNAAHTSDWLQVILCPSTHQVCDVDKIILLRPIELKSPHPEQKILNMSDVYNPRLD